jgi:hypothetical protein
MSRRYAFVLSLAIGLVAVIGIFATARTVGLGNQARAANDAQIARRAAALDRYAASLRKALAQPAPALPPLPGAAANGAPVAPPVRIVYHRPPPIVIHKHRPGGESERADGGEFDD